MNLDLNLDTFQQPRGFLKILQFLFAICAFATTVNFSTSFGFHAKCLSDTAVLVSHKVEYPFALDQYSQLVNCDNKTIEVPFVGNARSDAEFFVTTGVLCFLYSLAVGILYLVADNRYTESNKLPMIDFIITLIFAVFWLSGSAAWAKGCSTLKSAANPSEWLGETVLCKNAECTGAFAGVFTGIIISILFGFINFILWGANLWFLYKETTLFESIMKNTATPSTVTAGTGA